MLVIPYVIVNSIEPLTERDGVLTKSQIRRGPFNNSGSADAGKDPNWDFRTGTYKKTESYEQLFERDDPDDMNHGDQLLAKARKEEAQRGSNSFI